MSYPRPHAMIETAAGWTIEYVLRSYPLKDVPLRIRPVMVFLTAAWLVLLGILGLAPLPDMPINDKALHFFGLGLATFLIYFVLEVPEGPHKRIWYFRRAPLLLTLFVAFVCGGILSEFFQSMLPWKTFQPGDILANLTGSLAFLYLAHTLHRRARRRAELSTLYRPLNAASYRDAQGRMHPWDAGSGGRSRDALSGEGGIRLDPGARRLETVHGAEGDVWDDESEGEGEGDGEGADSGRRPDRAEESTDAQAGAAFALDDDDIV
ncbi:hypothetical protein Q5752_001960 [Cryptotrichosporon argae]